MTTIKVDPEGNLKAALDELTSRLEDQTPAWLGIGEVLVNSTKQRFATGKAPDGTPWAPNKPATIEAFVRSYSGIRTKKRKPNAKAKRIAGNKRPLIGRGRTLSQTINYKADKNSVEVGSPQIYAATHQFGAKQGEFGSADGAYQFDSKTGGTKVRKIPLPFGDIPARPFLGVSSDDEQAIRDTITDFIESFDV